MDVKKKESIEFITEVPKEQSDPFDVYMNSVIVPKVDEVNNEKEKYRGQFWTYFWTALFLVSVNTLVVLYRALMYHHALRVDQLIFIGFIAVVIVCWPLYSWKICKKQDIFATFLKFYGNLKYVDAKSTEADCGLPILPAHKYGQISYEVQGNYNGVDVDIREMTYLKQQTTRSKKITSGVMLAFDFHQPLNIDVLLFEKHGYYRKNKMPNMMNLNDQINIPAANYFNVFATDNTITANYLCSAFFEKILDIKDLFNAGKMYIMAKDSQINIFLEGSRIYFHNYKLWSRKIEYDKFRRLHKQIEEIFIFIEIIQAIMRDVHDERYS